MNKPALRVIQAGPRKARRLRAEAAPPSSMGAAAWYGRAAALGQLAPMPRPPSPPPPPTTPPPPRTDYLSGLTLAAAPVTAPPPVSSGRARALLIDGVLVGGIVFFARRIPLAGAVLGVAGAALSPVAALLGGAALAFPAMVLPVAAFSAYVLIRRVRRDGADAVATAVLGLQSEEQR